MPSIDPEKHILDLPADLSPALCEEVTDILSRRYRGIDIRTIGESILSQKIPCLHAGNGKPSIVWIGAQSGGDAITSTLLLRYFNEFHERMNTHGQIYGCNLRYLHELRSQYIIPMLNPDGVSCVQGEIKADHFFYARLRQINSGDDFSAWQANARGVDLRRNYAADPDVFMRRKKASLSGECGRCGEAPESEPESAALCRFLRTLPDIGLIIDLRTGEPHIEMPKNAAPKTISLGRRLGRLADIPLTSTSGEEFCDWASECLNLPAFTLFCGEEKAIFSLYAGIRELLFVAPTLIGN